MIRIFYSIKCHRKRSVSVFLRKIVSLLKLNVCNKICFGILPKTGRLIYIYYSLIFLNTKPVVQYEYKAKYSSYKIPIDLIRKWLLSFS